MLVLKTLPSVALRIIHLEVKDKEERDGESGPKGIAALPKTL